MERVEWWPFVDWSPPQFDGGVPPQGVDGGSSALTLQFVEALRYAAQLEDRFGEKDRAARYLELAKRASQSLMRLNWDEKTGLLADTPEKKDFSQQANALAVWLDVIPKEKQRAVMEKVLGPVDSGAAHMAEASYYFRFYVARAMVHAGLGDEYVAQLGTVAEDAGVGTFDMGGDAGAYAVGLACVERASYAGFSGGSCGDWSGGGGISSGADHSASWQAAACERGYAYA